MSQIDSTILEQRRDFGIVARSLIDGVLGLVVPVSCSSDDEGGVGDVLERVGSRLKERERNEKTRVKGQLELFLLSCLLHTVPLPSKVPKRVVKLTKSMISLNQTSTLQYPRSGKASEL